MKTNLSQSKGKSLIPLILSHTPFSNADHTRLQKPTFSTYDAYIVTLIKRKFPLINFSQSKKGGCSSSQNLQNKS